MSEKVTWKESMQTVINMFQNSLNSIPDCFDPKDPELNKMYLWPFAMTILDYVKEQNEFWTMYKNLHSDVMLECGNPFDNEDPEE